MTSLSPPPSTRELLATASAKSARCIVAALCLLPILAISAQAQSAIDSTFNGTGIVRSGIPNSQSFAISEQSDGGLVSSGSAQFPPTFAPYLIVFKVTEAGALDTTFGTDGVFTDSAAVDFSRSSDLVVDAADRIYVAADVVEDEESSMVVYRLTPEGVRDATFGENGLARVVNPAPFSRTGARAITLDGAGRIIVAGSYMVPNVERIAVARFLADGTPDESFGTNGLLVAPFNAGSFADRTQAVVTYPDGSLLVISRSEVSFNEFDVSVLKVNPDGQVDGSYGDNGAFLFNDPGNEDAFGALLQEDGAVVIVGLDTEDDPSAQFANGLALRVDAGGALDTSFGVGGKAEVFVDPAENTTANYYDVDLDDGEYVLIGDILDLGPFTRSLLLTRITTAGMAVTTYGESGSNVIPSPLGEGTSLQGTGLIVRPNGQYYFVANTEDASFSRQAAIGRLVGSTGTDIADGATPTSPFALGTAAPNPFSQRAVLKLTLAQPQHVEAALFDALGRRVAVLHEGFLSADSHELTVEVNDLPAGVYVVGVIGAGGRASQRVTIIR